MRAKPFDSQAAPAEPAARSTRHGAWSPLRWWTALRADRYLTTLIVLLLVSLPLVTHRVYASDEVQYYAYLRSIWFDGDLDFTNEYTHFINLYPASLAGLKRTNLDRLDDQGQPLTRRSDLPLNFGPIGTAVLWLPFFAVGHLVAVLAHAVSPTVPVDGYSAPYIWAITTGSALYSAAALLILYRLAAAYVSRPAAFWATLGVWLGSPVIFYSHGAPAYSHAASIFAVTAFLLVWQATRPLARRRWWQWVTLGLLAALVTCVREQDAVAPAVVIGAEALLLLPAIWRERRWSALRPLIGGGAIMAGAWAIGLVPQVATYCLLNGTCLPNNHVTQKLESGLASGLLQRAYEVAVSPQYGLIFWTPLAVPAFLGLIWLWRRDRTLTLALGLMVLATWVVNAVYSTGPTRGSFGARRFLNCTPVILLGLAAGYQALRERRLAPLAPILTLLGIWWNLGLVIQFAFNLMNRQRLELDQILLNQVTQVPVQLLERGSRLLLNRDSLFKN